MTLQKEMMVRCPLDVENKRYPRYFATGKISLIDEFSEKAVVVFSDVNGVGLYHEIPEDCSIEISKLCHCKIRKGAVVFYKHSKMIVCSCETIKGNDFYYYYIKDNNGNIFHVCETDLTVSYNDGTINPLYQLMSYEFQNPIWFTGRNIVSRTMNYIDKSLYGFNYLAGCKIFLKPHQLKTVMRCLQTPKCRYMLADEVGLGKTIEALSLLKIYINDNHNKQILIAVPDCLIEQWKNELAFKFKLFEGENIGSNYIKLVPISYIHEQIFKHYDFVIIDEVHRCLNSESTYEDVLEISKHTDNILMLSATPLQKRDDEFLRLLCLIQPDKYQNIDKNVFKNLIEQQNKIIKKVFNALDELNALNEALIDANGNKNEETEETFEAVVDELSDILGIVKDDNLKNLLDKIDYEVEDCGIAEFQSIIAYICENFQLEKSIIRNRRQKVDVNEDGTQAQRVLVDLSYDAHADANNDQWNAYIEFADWIENHYNNELNYKERIVPVINSLFSSGQAFYKSILDLSEDVSLPVELINASKRYADNENVLVNDSSDLDSECKIAKIIDYISNELGDGKVILFTNFSETFDLYKTILIKYFGEDQCCFFNKDMNSDELELNAYRFQVDEERQILLSDESGGEGRNFQHADYLIHIDIPWNANDIEQRIGRLDRIGRDVEKDVVSVVAYGKNTIEEDLFAIWNDGLHLFTQAQSGLEIIMGDIEDNIINSLHSSFKYGMAEAKSEMSVLVKEQLDELKKEQVYDIAGYQYKSINRMLEDTIEKYTKNETSLFGTAMMSWAVLSGFNGTRENEDVISFTKNSISLKSMANSLFMPPNMKNIIDNKLNQLRNRVRLLNNERMIHQDCSYIRGTFNRVHALRNDYLNFFAPGDDIFDSIIANSLNSYKGTCSGFVCQANIKWTGFIFTWKMELDESIIYAKHLNPHIIDQYKGYLPSEQIISVFDVSDSDIPDDEVASAFLMMVQNSRHIKLKSFGKRDGVNPPIAEFMKAFPSKKWHDLVKLASTSAIEKAKVKAITKEKPLLHALKNELNASMSAQMAAFNFYGNEVEIEGIKEQNKIIFELIKNAKLVLDSVCYVVMEND